MAELISTEEQEELDRLEAAIEKGMKSFLETGALLTAIRDGRFYRATHDTFESYCRERWDMTRANAYNLIAAACVVKNIEMSTIVDKPKNESQVRPLTKLPQEQQASAWSEAVAMSPNGKPTAKIVQQVVNTRLPKTEQIPDEPEEEPSKPEPSRADNEAMEICNLFNSRLAKVSDGGCYTLDQVCAAFECSSQPATEFIRMCEVSPAVKVNRTYGHKGLTIYTFVATKCVTGHQRIRQLAEDIATDSSAGTRANVAAAKIIQMLGG